MKERFGEEFVINKNCQSIKI